MVKIKQKDDSDDDSFNLSEEEAQVKEIQRNKAVKLLRGTTKMLREGDSNDQAISQCLIEFYDQ